ncbi:Craniofacial development protein 1 [Haplosporangium gracile]|nr:Craniofacial development protein 1 [Haplosporangium gracile]
MANPKTVAEKPPKTNEVESDSDDESDDEDYAPDEKDFQSDGEDLDGSSDDDDNTTNDAYTSISTSRSGKRRADNDPSSSTHKKSKPQQEPTPQEQAEALNKKSRLDALWTEMNAPVPKPALSARRLDLSVLSGSESASDKGAGSGTSGKMVTITTTYDFAGETVTVTKDVPENSKEAKEYAAKNDKAAPVDASSSNSTSATAAAALTTTTATKDSILSTAQNLDTITSTSSTATPITENSKPTDASSILGSNPAPGGPKITTRPSILDSIATKTKAPVRYIRKKSNLDELAATYGVKKPPKLNTLEKSKLDWKNFVGKEGIEDELKHHNKDGYMEKVAFLQRTDERRDQEYQQLKKKRR